MGTLSGRAAALAALTCAFALPAPASAALFSHESSFGSALGPGGGFVTAAGVATDDAGRVYVADAGAGRVEVYDNATSGNAFLRTVGDDVLDCPVGVAIDNRGRIYVADGCRDAVVMFDSFVDGAPVRRQFGGSGTAIGQMDNPRFIAVDRTARLYVTERDNARVQSWRPRGGKQVPVSAFGVGDPPAFVEPEGIARDASGRIYVADDNPGDGELRMFDSRGLLLERIAGPGSAPGQVSSPRGLLRDPAGRLLVVDSGNSRLQVFSTPGGAGSEAGGDTGADEDGDQTGRISQAQPGSRLLDVFGAPGDFLAPTGVAFAPGALVYVADTGNGRIVRLRYDDADGDGAIDARDTCPGLANPLQRDTDSDGAGDDCDPDDDNDGIADDADRCPTTRRGRDANGDGCGDPRSRISAPRDRKTFRRSRPPSRLSGRASADEIGVAAVQFALARLRGSRCAWYDGRRFGPPGPCDQPTWLAASGNQRWSARVRIRGRGRYRLLSRAIQTGGIAETTFTRSNQKTFRVR